MHRRWSRETPYSVLGTFPPPCDAIAAWGCFPSLSSVGKDKASLRLGENSVTDEAALTSTPSSYHALLDLFAASRAAPVSGGWSMPALLAKTSKHHQLSKSKKSKLMLPSCETMRVEGPGPARHERKRCEPQTPYFSVSRGCFFQRPNGSAQTQTTHQYWRKPFDIETLLHASCGRLKQHADFVSSHR